MNFKYHLYANFFFLRSKIHQCYRMRLPTRIMVVAGLVGLAAAIAAIQIQPSSSEATVADASESRIDSKKARDVNATER